ncbi:amidohydrolase [Antrihabitans sp. YC2-6]|uniref:amidohydrolase family protein n=1 Tax=Antrihabitans sp. YC2-6 TaxID=2799498 RepID=UPI0018F4C438|nr:amidohydrolase family protein [Antrihabitans sp. YC2-6]MBJ8347651.1 amidohydrolase family protein [Antrihabitans sp. YC2-6]
MASESAPGQVTSDFRLRIVDTHMHQWDPQSTPRDVLLQINSLIGIPRLLDATFRLLPKSDRESIADPVYLANPYLVGDYRRDIAGLPVESCVHIESGWRGKGEFASVDETKWIASLPFPRAGSEGRGPRLGAIIGHADPRTPNFGAVLDAHQDASELFRGVRCIAAHHPDRGVRSWTNDPRLLVQPRFLDGFAQLAQRDLTFDAWVYSQDLPDVAELARRYPEVTIVLDHVGTPAGIFGPVGRNTGRSLAERRGLLDAWRDDLAAVAARQNVVAKLTGLMLPVLGHELPLRGHSVPVQELVERVAPLVDHTLDVFGADRTMWGSNTPLEKPVSDASGTVETVLEALKPRGNVVADQVFRATAQRVYRIAEGGPH